MIRLSVSGSDARATTDDVLAESAVGPLDRLLRSWTPSRRGLMA